MERFSETEFCKFWIDEGLLYFIYKPIPYLNLEIAQSIVSRRLLFQESQPFFIFCNTGGIADSSKDARDYLAQQGSLLANAIAIYDQRGIGKFMLNYYLIRNKPIVPTEFFTNHDEAIAFLKSRM